MSFEALLEKVRQAEQALEGSEREAAGQWRRLQSAWRSAWTPGRIVVAGLACGFLVGRARPMRLAGSGGVLQLVTALSGLLASGSAQAAAEQAADAADAAETVATAVPTDAPMP